MSDPSDPSDLQRELNNLLSRDVSSYPQWQDQTTVTSSDLPQASDVDYATTLGNFGDEWGYYALPEPLEDQLFLQQPLPLLGQSPGTLLQSFQQNNTFNNTRSFANAGLKAAPAFDQLGPHRIIGTTPSPGAFSENVEPNPENNNMRDLAIPNLKMGYHLNTLGRITWLMVSGNLFIQLYFYR